MKVGTLMARAIWPNVERTDERPSQAVGIQNACAGRSFGRSIGSAIGFGVRGQYLQTSYLSLLNAVESHPVTSVRSKVESSDAEWRRSVSRIN